VSVGRCVSVGRGRVRRSGACPSVGGVSVGRGRVRRPGAPVPTLPVVGAHPTRMGE